MTDKIREEFERIYGKEPYEAERIIEHQGYWQVFYSGYHAALVSQNQEPVAEVIHDEWGEAHITWLIKDSTDVPCLPAGTKLYTAPQYQDPVVKLPTSVEEAELMEKVGYEYLKQYAPEKLTWQASKADSEKEIATLRARVAEIEKSKTYFYNKWQEILKLYDDVTRENTGMGG